MRKPAERSAVVGWGSISPLGSNAEETWRAMLSEQSGISLLEQSWASDLTCKIAGCVKESAFTELTPIQRRRSDRCAQLALLAARQAWSMAASHAAGLEPSRIAVVVGTGIGGLSTMHEQHLQLTEGGPSRVNPLTVPMLIPDAASGQVAIDLGLHGGAHTPVSACASGAEALMLAQMLAGNPWYPLKLGVAPISRMRRSA